MQCPVDQSQLQTERHYGVTIDRCQSCRGVWLDAGELPHLVRLFSEDESNQFLQLAGRKQLRSTSPREFWSKTTRQCPVDATNLERRYFGGNSRIGIEHCPACQGFWFDGEELASVRKVVAPNPELDAAIARAGGSFHTELSDNYNDRVIAIMDRISHPEELIDDAANLAFHLLKSYVVAIV